MTLPRRLQTFTLTVLCGGALLNCSSESTEPPNIHSGNAPSLSSPPLVAPHNQTVTLWQSQQLHINAAIDEAASLEKSLQLLLAEPTAINLEASNQQWLLAAEAIEALALIGPIGRENQSNAWQAINQIFDFITVWPAQHGYLDKNVLHGKTGLIYDIDTPITPENLRHQHGLTHTQDASLGIYPIGLILRASSDDFTESTALNESERMMGYTSTHELANNRRRQLIQLQAKLLVSDLTDLHTAWARRDRNSALNAASQPSIEQQQKHHIKAGLNLLTQQLLELKNTPYTGDNLQQAQWSLAHRNKRWETQLQYLGQWLSLLGISYLAEPILQLQQSLNAQFTPLNTAEEEASNRALRPRDKDIEAQLAAMVLALKKTLENRPQP